MPGNSIRCNDGSVTLPVKMVDFIKFVVVQSLSRVGLFAMPWTAAGQAALSVTISLSLLKLMFIEPVMPSNHLILLLVLPSVFPSIRERFPMSRLFTSGGQSIGPSASASALPVNIQGWFPLGLTGLISLLSKGLLRVFSSTTVWRHQFLKKKSNNISLWLLIHMNLFLQFLLSYLLAHFCLICFCFLFPLSLLPVVLIVFHIPPYSPTSLLVWKSWCA